ncbi:MAG: hypothetical protein AVDCRST_MAG93-3833 [uncultured Chloroflexia bacterium]|uniref:Uncharacterized protein n=1 Tax=uncultured Chloroflexia bacterium TaxID=1672391 RepID=A0A6J4JXG7_9CHLR|nr:MAG: hypothetical protein AVDCRST_MAG93-3833 [uncultured Chloroflexia bacterium]
MHRKSSLFVLIAAVGRHRIGAPQQLNSATVDVFSAPYG